MDFDCRKWSLGKSWLLMLDLLENILFTQKVVYIADL